MKILLIISLLIFGSPAQAKGSDTLVSCHLKSAPFREFCDVIYQGSGVRIYYQDSGI